MWSCWRGRHEYAVGHGDGRRIDWRAEVSFLVRAFFIVIVFRLSLIVSDLDPPKT
jgi:hypothetical protein